MYSAWLDVTQPLNAQSLYEAIESIIILSDNDLQGPLYDMGQYKIREYGIRGQGIETIQIMHRKEEDLHDLLLFAEQLIPACSTWKELIHQASIALSS